MVKSVITFHSGSLANGNTGIVVESIASEGDEVGEGVGRHRNDEVERELYLCVLLQKWRKPQVNDAGWAVFLLPQRKLWPKEVWPMLLAR